VGVSEEGTIYVLPDIFWKGCDTSQMVESMIDLAERRHPLVWWAGGDHIKKSIAPFLEQRKMARRVFFYVEEVHEGKDLMTRAQPLHGLMSMGLVKWPKFAHWYQQAETEMLMFPAGKHDDFVATMAHIGRGVNQMRRGERAIVPVKYVAPSLQSLTISWLKRDEKEQKQLTEIKNRGF
jgi:predicted phage terminase large subunit-like protein